MRRFRAAELTVVWQGITFPPVDEVSTFSTVIRPLEYGYDDPSNEQIGEMACSEQHDGEQPYDEINVMFVYYGSINPIVDDEDAADQD